MFCCEVLHRLPSEVDAGMSELLESMTALSVQREMENEAMEKRQSG